MKEGSSHLQDQRTNGLGLLLGVNHSRFTVQRGRDRSFLGQAGGLVHRWPVKSAWSSQVKGQPGADPLPPQAEPTSPRGGDTPGERRGELVLPAAARRRGSKGHKLVRAAQCASQAVRGELAYGLLPFCHPASLTLSSKTCTCKSIRQNRGGGKQKKPSQGSRV